jgi:WD40 repeat protein
VAIADEAIAPVDPQLGRAVDFYRDVYPILESKCLACHNAAVKEGDLLLESAAAMLKGGASGTAVVAGKPEESLVYLLAARSEEPVMPPLPNKAQAKPLTPQELGILRQWIQEGAPAGERPASAGGIQWQPVPEHYKAVYSLALSPDRRFVAAGRGNRIFIYDLPGQRELTRLTDPALLPLQHEGQPLYGPGVAQRDFVHALAFSRDGRWLASGGYREIKLWERLGPSALLQWQLPEAPQAVALNAEGTWAAIALSGGTVQLWNLTNGQQGTAPATGAAVIKAVAFHPQGEQLFTGAADGTIQCWNLGDGSAAGTLATGKGITALSIRPSDPLQVIAAHEDQQLRIWSWPGGEVPEGEAPKPIREIGGHGQTVLQLTLLASGNEVHTVSRDGTTRIFNLDNGSQQFSQNLGAPLTGGGVSADGQLIAAAGENSLARIWGRNNQQKAEVKGQPALDRAAKHQEDELAVAQSRFKLQETVVTETEKDLAQREESVKKAQELVEKTQKELAEAEPKVTEAEAKLQEADSKLAENPEDANLKKAKEEAEKNLKTVQEARDKAREAVASAERGLKLTQQSVETVKQNLVQAQADKTAAEEYQKAVEQQLAMAREQAAQGVQPIRAAALNPEGRVLATATDSQLVQLWDAGSGLPLDTIGPLPAVPVSLQFTANGSLLVLGADGGTSLWEITPRFRLAATFGAKPDDPLDISESPLIDRVLSLAFSPDGTLLASGGGEPSRSGEIIFWNVPAGTVAKALPDAHSDTVFDLEFSRDGQQLVSGGADKFVKLFDVAAGKLIRPFEGHTNHVLGVAIQADGSSLASAGADNAIKIWNVRTGEQRRTITNYGKQVTSIDYIGTTDKLISSGGDKTVRYHQAGNGSNYRNFGGSEDYVYRAVSTGDEQLVVAAGEDGAVRVWNGQNAQSVATFPAPAPPEVAQSN